MNEKTKIDDQRCEVRGYWKVCGYWKVWHDDKCNGAYHCDYCNKRAAHAQAAVDMQGGQSNE